MSKPRFVNRLTSIERVFVLSDLLQSSTTGRTAGELNRLAGARLGEHSTRTTLRDLNLLERLGRVCRADGRWVWSDPQPDEIETTKRPRTRRA